MDETAPPVTTEMTAPEAAVAATATQTADSKFAPYLMTNLGAPITTDQGAEILV